MSHTPGPWKLRTRVKGLDGYGVEQFQHIVSGYADYICYDVSGIDSLANAHLIAAAPDMLAALKAIFED